jgi:hypothetical protein
MISIESWDKRAFIDIEMALMARAQFAVDIFPTADVFCSVSMRTGWFWRATRWSSDSGAEAARAYDTMGWTAITKGN